MMKEYFENKKILITGGNGFVGSYLAKELLEIGACVSILVSPEDKEVGDNLKSKLDGVYVENLKNAKGIECIIRELEPDLIYHLAAIGSVPFSKVNPVETFNVNFNGTLNILESIRKVGKGKLIYISSGEIYETSKDPINENNDILPASPYSASKIAAEYLVSSYNRAYDIDIVILRPFNMYGVGNLKNVVFKFIDLALKGEDLNVEGGSQLKNFTYVGDSVKAMLLAGSKKEAIGNIFNIGSRVTISIIDLAKKIVELSDSNSNVIIGEDRDVENKDFACDYKKIEDALGWKPEVGLDSGLKKTIEWVRGNN